MGLTFAMNSQYFTSHQRTKHRAFFILALQKQLRNPVTAEQTIVLAQPNFITHRFKDYHFSASSNIEEPLHIYRDWFHNIHKAQHMKIISFCYSLG
jgi:hypothetical protein